MKNLSSVKKNFLSLSLIQIASYLFPLLTLPYITRIFGPELYGLFNYATSIMGYFGLLINFGFELSGSREIAINRNNPEKLSLIFSSIIFSKLILFLICAIIFIMSIFTIHEFKMYLILYVIIFLGNFFNIFFPTWFFQGMEKLNITAIFSFSIKLISTIMIFLVIRNKNDLINYALIGFFTQILISIISLYIIIRKFRIGLVFIKLKNIKEQIVISYKIFISTIVINLYTTTNFVILGSLSSKHDVGIYTAAYKVMLIIMSVLNGPFGQALYPNIAHAMTQSIEVGISKMYYALKRIVPLTFLLGLICFIFSESIIKILYGPKFLDAILTLKILSFLPMIITISNIFGIQGLLTLKQDKYLTLITICGAISGLTLNFVLVPFLRHNGTAISWLITEILITVLTYTFFQKIKNNLRIRNV